MNSRSSAKIKYLFFLFVIYIVSCQNQTDFRLTTLSGFTMGTTYHVKFLSLEKINIDEVKYKSDIDSILIQVNNEMSTYIDSSEISRFNRLGKNDWFPISNDFYNVLQVALMLCEGTNGAYDITIGPLVNLWGFGPDIRNNIIPAQQKIDSVKNLVGYKYLELRSKPKSMKKVIDGLYLDLSSIAKGFGVDKVSEFLLDSGINNFMVEIGGEVRTNGINQDNVIWEIGISAPDGSNSIATIIPLENKALATSGSYNNFFEVAGKKFSHTIDPRTGNPVTHNLVSVSVISNSCMLADGLATAIDVLGPVDGYNFALKEGIPIIMFINKNNEFNEKRTPAFQELLK